MNMKRVILAAILVFLVGGVAGAGIGAIHSWHSSKSDLPVPTYSELNEKDQEQMDEFVEKEEKEHPDGMKDIDVEKKYEQPKVDGNGNLVTEEKKNEVETKKDTQKPNKDKEENEESKATTNQIGIVTVSESGSLRMREGAGTDYEVVGGLRRGEQVTILQEKDGWYQIKTEDGIKAWASTEYIKIQ